MKQAVEDLLDSDSDRQEEQRVSDGFEVVGAKKNNMKQQLAN